MYNYRTACGVYAYRTVADQPCLMARNTELMILV